MIDRHKMILVLSVLTIFSALLSGNPAFSQQTNRPNKGVSPTSSQGTSASEAQNASQSKPVEHNGVYEVGGPVLPPKLLKARYPKYTWAAKRAHFEGDCTLSMVIGTDGRVTDVAIRKSVGYGLDKRAADAVKRDRFEPATLHGKAVPVRIKVIVHFAICPKGSHCRSNAHAVDEGVH